MFLISGFKGFSDLTNEVRAFANHFSGREVSGAFIVIYGIIPGKEVEFIPFTYRSKAVAHFVFRVVPDEDGPAFVFASESGEFSFSFASFVIAQVPPSGVGGLSGFPFLKAGRLESLLLEVFFDEVFRFYFHDPENGFFCFLHFVTDDLVEAGKFFHF